MAPRARYKLWTLTRHPLKAYRATVRKIKELLLWNYLYDHLPEPKKKSSIVLDGPAQERIVHDLKKAGIRVVRHELDLASHRDYLARADYTGFKDYYGGEKAKTYLIEKSLEHFLAADLLQLSKDDVYIDVGNADSPAPQIYHKLFGCKAFRQDLTYPKGVHGDLIGGDAGSMPLGDGFATKMALHCAFEHFEQDSDIRFVREAGRVLRKPGRLVILPLYLSTKYSIQTDPATLPLRGFTFETDATLFCARGFGNRHARFYDVPHFMSRIVNNLGSLNLTVYLIENEKEVDPSCYVKFVALFEKP